MRILVRKESDTCEYVWKKVTTVNPIRYGNYYVETPQNKGYECYSFEQIIRIEGDYRKNGKYVMCTNCGKVVRKSALAAHYEEQEHNANCMKCDHLRLTEVDGSVKHKLMPDGKVKTSIISEARCGEKYSYRAIPLESVNKPETCKYYACRRSGTKNLPSDTLSRFPNPYKMLLTEKTVIENGWKFLEGGEYTRSYTNKNGKVVAIFDRNGILDHFSLLCRGDYYRFMYSDVYDEFIDGYGVFGWNHISSTSIERYKKQVRALYQ